MILHDLPTEILYMIKTDLSDHVTATAVSMTCKRMRSIVGALNLKQAPLSMQRLLELEQWPVYTDAKAPSLPRTTFDFFTCTFCRRIRDCIFFTNHALQAQAKGSIQLTASDKDNRRLRRCIDCFIQTYEGSDLSAEMDFGGKYVPELPEAKNGGKGRVCGVCLRFQKVTAYKRGLIGADLVACETCLDDCEAGTGCRPAHVHERGFEHFMLSHRKRITSRVSMHDWGDLLYPARLFSVSFARAYFAAVADGPKRYECVCRDDDEEADWDMDVGEGGKPKAVQKWACHLGKV
ncbi:hypothetical protein FH972_024138 [Carpinus fangiana]|uniref:F-box domain-containing protein n=1 Tax=Carpinus fangiana TaxID=176857 RepID=A0A5N6KXI5_9ROSI|nr:hypothetical protein FH972_024138 [Carpinus fangiana]